jgi:hypothetical protein
MCGARITMLPRFSIRLHGDGLVMEAMGRAPLAVCALCSRDATRRTEGRMAEDGASEVERFGALPRQDGVSGGGQDGVSGVDQPGADSRRTGHRGHRRGEEAGRLTALADYYLHSASGKRLNSPYSLCRSALCHLAQRGSPFSTASSLRTSAPTLDRARPAARPSGACGSH